MATFRFSGREIKINKKLTSSVIYTLTVKNLSLELGAV